MGPHVKMLASALLVSYAGGVAEPRPETRYAKQLWLYGAGDGAPVKNIPKLAELSGVTCETIRRYLPQWERESTEILANTSEMGLALVLSEEKLEQHSKDSIFIRDQVDKLKFEIENLEKVAVRLGEWMDKFDGDDVVTALQIFDAWQRSVGTESHLRGQFVAMKKLWDDKVGLDALRDVAVTSQKEIAKGKAKLAVKAMEAETGLQVRNVSAGGVFSRVVNVPQAPEACSDA
jgi:hypothetical protein